MRRELAEARRYDARVRAETGVKRKASFMDRIRARLIHLIAL